MTRTITNSDDVIDIRDVIARFEELDSELTSVWETEESDTPEPARGDFMGFDEWIEVQAEDGAEAAEYLMLKALLEECCGKGDDKQWRGDWYPGTLIRDLHFQTYAQDLAEDIGAVKLDMSWPYTCIDWAKAARELQYDYTSVEFDGVTYYTR